MKITVELTPEQVEEIAAIVAQMLAARPKATVLTVTQAAKMLGVHHETVRNRIKAGLLPRVPGLGAVRIPGWAVDRMMNGLPATP